jgi:hypothetical protein
MRKMLTFAIVGGAVGAGIALTRTNDVASGAPVETDSSAMRTAGSGALAGLVVGFVLDRRSHRRAKQVTKTAKVAATMAGVAKAAKPRIEQAIEASRPHLEHAAGATREVAARAAEVAQARLSQAA